MINKMYHWLVDKPDKVVAQGFLWNMIGSFVFALGTMVLTIVVNRIVGDYSGGDFAMALAVGQLMATVGYFETRTYQVTDTKQVFSFSDYFITRIITDFVMIIASIGYILIKGYTLEKSILVFLMCIYKMIDTFADVYEGEFQLKDRIDISGKSIALRTTFSVLGLVITLYITKNLYLSCFVGIVLAILFVYLTNVMIIKEFSIAKFHINVPKIKMILIECFPLFVSTFMSTYILNASRYAVEANLTSNFHSKYTAIFLPVSTINLCIGFIFKPMLTSMARRWNNHRINEFIKILLLVFVGIIGVTIVILIGAYFLGIPVLSFLYNTDLNDFKMAMLVLLVGGGINSANVIIFYSLTVMRQQKSIFVSYLITFVASLIIPNFLTQYYGINGAACSFTLIMGILFICSMVIFIYYLLKEKKKNAYRE